MYHAHFALAEEPFGASPDQRFFFATEQHREALATLYYAVRQRRGFSLLYGKAGLGKTSVLVRLIKMLDDQAEVAYLPYPYFDRATVLESVLLSLGLDAAPSLAQNHRLLCEYLMKTRAAGRMCVVIFDEAQDLSRDTLESIRMLSNFETPSEKLLQIVLAGQPRLAETLGRPDCEQLRQRLNAVARLKPLGDREVRDYIAHRLKTCGCSAALFTPDALDAITAASDGVPRNVNTICFNALTLAYALSHRQVGLEEVAEVLRDLDLAIPPKRQEGVSVQGNAVIREAATVAARNPEEPAPDPGDAAEPARVAKPMLASSEVGSAFRPAFLAAGVALLAAGAFFFHTFLG